MILRLPSLRRRGLKWMGPRRWRALDDDPQFLFYVPPIFPYVVFCLSNADRQLNPRIYADRGEGLVSEISELYPTLDSVYVVNVETLSKNRWLRFDPASFVSTFEFCAFAALDRESIISYLGARIHHDGPDLGSTPIWQTNSAFARAEYKRQWNMVSTTDDDAKQAVTGIVDETTIAESARHSLQMLQQFVGIGPDDIVLEIGAGFGRVGEVLAPICREWIGTDVSENMIFHINRRLSRFSNVRAIATNGFDLTNIPSSSVDTVYCTVVFMHLDEWERYNYIAEGFRILKPCGRMLVDNVNLASDGGWGMFEELRALPPRSRPANISKMSTPQELEIYFCRAGFADVRHAEINHMIITYGSKPN